MEGKEWVWNNGALVEEELIRMKKQRIKNEKKTRKSRRIRVCKVSKKL